MSTAVLGADPATGTRVVMMRRRKVLRTRLVVDPVACEAVGLCAYLAPDIVELDRWGYPIVQPARLRPEQAAAAGRAVRACPRRALHLLHDPHAGDGPAG